MRRLQRKTRKDRTRNTAIRNGLKMGSVVQEIEKRNLKWHGHLIMRNIEKKIKQVFEARPEGRKVQEGSRKEREQYIREMARYRRMELNTFKKIVRIEDSILLC